MAATIEQHYILPPCRQALPYAEEMLTRIGRPHRGAVHMVKAMRVCEHAHLADDIQELAIGDGVILRVDQGLVHDQQRLQQLLLGVVGLRIVLQHLLHIKAARTCPLSVLLVLTASLQQLPLNELRHQQLSLQAH